MCRWQTESACPRLSLLILHLQNPRDGLLLEPFTHVPFIGGGARGEFCRGQWAGFSESTIEAESNPDVYAEDVKRTLGGLKQSFDECISLLGGRVC